LNEKKLEEYDDVFDFIGSHFPDWERLLTDGNIKIKTNKPTVPFTDIEQILQKFNLRITDVSYTDYYGIIFGIEKL
jgi:acetolactate synthase small subunit